MATKGKCERCGKAATFRCPKCVELSLSESLFCGQECFKAAWKTHKAKHERMAGVAKMVAESMSSFGSGTGDLRFMNYVFTGGVRPSALSPTRAVPDSIPRPDYAVTGIPASEDKVKHGPIEVKTPEQIAGMREACRVAREVIDIAAAAVRPGITTDEIDRIVHEATIERGAYPSPLNYRGFPKSVCTSVNEIVCHGIPDMRVLVEGDIVNVDVTCYYKGYHGDLNETYPVGNVDESSKRLIQATYESLELAIKSCKPEMPYRKIGDAITDHIHNYGYGVVRDFTGHGIGSLFHPSPCIPHYKGNKTPGIMKPGHTFTIEPMINEGSYNLQVWPDGWTAVTCDGKRSAQFEHTLLMTKDGAEILTKRTKNSYPYWFLQKTDA